MRSGFAQRSGRRVARVIALVLRGGLTPVLLGLFAGTIGASFSGRAVSGMLFGITPRDPASLAVVAITLTAAAFVASYLPARRAGKVDPIIALRTE